MKKILVSILIILMLFSIVSVKAEDLKAVSFTADKDEIEKGEEVVLTIQSNELTGIEGTIKYDTSVWNVTNKSSQNSFTLNEETGKFALANLSGEEKVSATVTLKSKENTTVNSSTINICEITASDKSGQSFNISDREATIKFKSKDNITNDIQENEVEIFENIVETKKNTVNNVQTFPETGANSAFVAIVVLVVISGILYFRYKKYNF